jgi:catechol 2,3-dioxygenase-like lactoylglutathione lyase family enzyme
MTIKRMDHFTVVTDQLEVTLDFYTSLLGFVEGPRPDFGIPGYWFYIDERPVLHIIGVDKMPAVRRGALDHMAYWAEGFVDTVERLKARDVAFRIIRTPRPFSNWQLFFEDPNGAEVELDFDPSEPAPEDWKAYARAAAR